MLTGCDNNAESLAIKPRAGHVGSNRSLSTVRGRRTNTNTSRKLITSGSSLLTKSDLDPPRVVACLAYRAYQPLGNGGNQTWLAFMGSVRFVAGLEAAAAPIVSLALGDRLATETVGRLVPYPT